MAPNQSVSVSDLSDDELYALIADLDKKRDQIGFLPALDLMFSPSVYRLHDLPLVVKQIPSNFNNEASTMNYVSRHTTIPIPRVYRVLPVKSSPDYSWIVMDFIEGDCLRTVWPKLGWWRRLQVALTLRSHIQQLRRVPLPYPDIPGPFDETGTPRLCYGEPFESDGDGPFPTLESLASWFDHHNHRTQIIFHEAGRRPVERYAQFDRSEPLVLCHNDLGHTRNIMLGKDGRVWLVDWAFCGAYPARFEYASFGAWQDAASPIRAPPLSFTRLVRSGLVLGGAGRWYYEHYARMFYVWIEAHRLRYVDSDYFAKAGVAPEVWQPTTVARPPFTVVLSSKVLDMVYDMMLAVHKLFGGS